MGSDKVALRRAYIRERYRKFKDAGKCGRCGKIPSVPGRNCDECRQRERDRKDYQREYRKRNIEEERGRQRVSMRRSMQRRIGKGLCSRCGKEPLSNGWTCEKCTDIAKENSRKYYQRTRAEVFAKYGEKCACCGESESAFLTIDHMDNNGAEHRRKLSGMRTSTNFYVWLKRQGFPSGFQTLCWNCNSGKSVNGGICPHQEKATKCP